MRGRKGIRSLFTALLTGVLLLGGCSTADDLAGPSDAAQNVSREAANEDPWCEVSTPESWFNPELGRPSDEYLVHYSKDFEWSAWTVYGVTPPGSNAVHSKPVVKSATGELFEPFDVPEGWRVQKILFTDSYLVVLTAPGGFTEAGLRIQAWDLSTPETPPKTLDELDSSASRWVFVGLTASGDRISWLERIIATEQNSISIYDLTTQTHTYPVTDSTVTQVAWDGDTLVWVDASGTIPRLTGVNPNGTEWEPPEQIRNSAGTNPVVSDGIWTWRLWTQQQGDRLYVWAPGWEAPQFVEKWSAEIGSNLWPTGATNGFVFYRKGHQQWVADLTTKSTALLFEDTGAVLVDHFGRVSIGTAIPEQIEKLGFRSLTLETSVLPRLDTFGS